ncbi:hypothetical protein [Flexivirga caeni]|uniref:Uncharacterized protein n=1 Tax=Flexivirga caeni TaxID=2294115 RepID=A0A3M9MC04_9MICO|nr:hypothetical protein [Flexivirga caeni]RNI23076.1 hypothetical protein EFY87_07990 [Flexivirga caeni]
MSLGVAAVAAELTAEVVLEDAVTIALGGAALVDFLNPLEQIVVDDWLVVAVVQFALIGGVSGVVRVGEHSMEGVCG